MKKRSLLLVTVDCLRADHVGFLGYSRPVTPFLDSLAASSLVFTDAMVAGAPTFFSFPAIIASRYPLALGRDVLGIAPGEPTIATALHDAGYATAAFLAGNPYLSPRFGYHQGFDTFHDFLGSALPGESNGKNGSEQRKLSKLNDEIQALSRRSSLASAAYDEIYFWYGQWRTSHQRLSMDQLRRYPAADVIVDQARSWISSLGDQPFFLWLHLMDPHHPYYPPEEALTAVGEPNLTTRRARFLNSFWNRDVASRRLQKYRKEILSLYDAGVYWADRQIARLVRALQQFERWDETVFAVTADHGEEFLEHGARYHSPVSLPESLIHVPLLVRAPDAPAARLSQGPFSLIHLAPSLLEAVGVSVPESFQGRSCWSPISAGELPHEPAIAECVDGCTNPFRISDRMRPRLMAVRDRNYKMVLHFDEKVERVYDLNVDPTEESPVPPDELRKERAYLLQRTREHIRNIRAGQNVELRTRARVRNLQQMLESKREAPIASADAESHHG